MVTPAEENLRLKLDSHLPKKNLCYLLDWKLYKMIKNAFYFNLKALLALKTFSFLSQLFGHLRKTD